jgi:hypothetical protein
MLGVRLRPAIGQYLSDRGSGRSRNYLWADTEELWRVPGLNYHDGMASYDLDNAGLLRAFKQMQWLETTSGQWSLGGTTLPFGKELQSRFPLVGRFLDEEGRPATSQLPPEQVAKSFGEKLLGE